MDLRDYVRVLRRGWPVILAFVIVGLAAGIGLTLTSTKVYQASVQLFVAASQVTNISQLASGNTFTQNQVQSYTSIATSPAVTGPVVRQLGLGRLGITPQDLAAKISSDAPVNTVLVNIHVTDHDPARAARLANAVANRFASVVEHTEQTKANGSAVVKLTVIHPATVPGSPIKPVPVLNIGLGFVLGLLLGVGVVIVRDVLDNTVKGPSDFDELGVSVLGKVPLDKRTAKNPIALRGDPHSTRAEAYRLLRTNLQFVNVDNPPRVIAITSAVPGEGKSTTAMNLAAVLAEAGYRVCLIDADLRRPTLASTLGLVPDVGLTTVLIGKVPLERALQNVGRNLAVLTSGPIPPNPSELLHTAQTRTVIRTIADHVDYTIIDTPP
ncbi:MAG: polysaccharide biosynthesis tyrosine autokinase, partial [Mycobacterium sp.]|nr:polysaccharide biosynthesis tyrosine autokinase [Mycobacterium sp.]